MQALNQEKILIKCAFNFARLFLLRIFSSDLIADNVNLSDFILIINLRMAFLLFFQLLHCSEAPARILSSMTNAELFY